MASIIFLAESLAHMIRVVLLGTSFESCSRGRAVIGLVSVPDLFCIPNDSSCYLLLVAEVVPVHHVRVGDVLPRGPRLLVPTKDPIGALDLLRQLRPSFVVVFLGGSGACSTSANHILAEITILEILAGSIIFKVLNNVKEAGSELVAHAGEVVCGFSLTGIEFIIVALLSFMGMGNSKSLHDVGEGLNTPGGCEIDGYIGIKILSVSYEQDPIKPKKSKWNLRIMGALTKTAVFVTRKEPRATADVARRATTGVNNVMIDYTWKR